jgi:hypothetical protein
VKEKEENTLSNVGLTLSLLKWRIWRVPNEASKWQTGLNSAFKGLMATYSLNISGNMPFTLFLYTAGRKTQQN